MKSQRELSAHLCVCLWSQFVVKVSKVLNMLTELTSGRNKTNVNKLKLYSQRQLLRHTPGPNQGYRTAPVTDRLHIYCINAIFIKAFTIKGETCNGHRTINVQLQGTAVSLRWTCPVCCQRLTDINIKVPLLRRTLCPLLVDTVGCFHSASCAVQDSPSFVGKKITKQKEKETGWEYFPQIWVIAWNWRRLSASPRGPGEWSSHLGAVNPILLHSGAVRKFPLQP